MAKYVTKEEIKKMIKCDDDREFMILYEKACNEEKRHYSHMNDDARHKAFKKTGITERAAEILSREKKKANNYDNSPEKSKEGLVKESLALIHQIMEKLLPAEEAFKMCLEIDEKYPGIGYDRSAQFFYNKMGGEG